MPHGRLLAHGVCRLVTRSFGRWSGSGGPPQPATLKTASGTPTRCMAAAAMVLSPVTTPSDYHRIVSPTLTIPTDVTQPIAVGLLSCQRQSIAQLSPRPPRPECWPLRHTKH